MIERCVQERLGSIFLGRIHRRVLVRGWEDTSHKCPRADCGNVWNLGFPESLNSNRCCWRQCLSSVSPHPVDILQWCKHKGIHLTAQHIPGKLNEVTTFLGNLEENEQVSLKWLTWKVAMLLSLVLAHRSSGLVCLSLHGRTKLFLVEWLKAYQKRTKESRDPTHPCYVLLYFIYDNLISFYNTVGWLVCITNSLCSKY